MDSRLKIIIPEQFTGNGRFDAEGFAKYLQTPNTFEFEYEKECDNDRNFRNWFKDMIDITKWYLNKL
jgi:hypothetical protein